MAALPREYENIADLAEKMAAGLAEHPELFPTCDPAALTATLQDYHDRKAAYQSARAAAAAAAAAKKAAVAALQAALKDQARLARVDAAAAPGHLAYLGLPNRKPAAAILPPEPPGTLRVEYDGTTAVTLLWDKPPYDTRRPVGIYQVQRRDHSSPQAYNQGWQLEGVTFANRFELTGRKMGAGLHFRVVAANNAGGSLESNEVIL